MKYFVLCFLFSGSSFSLFSQSLSSNPVMVQHHMNVSPVLQWQTPSQGNNIPNAPGLRMRNTGKTLTILGGAMLIGGIALVSSADEVYYTRQSSSYGTYEEGDAQGAIGVLMMVGGAGMTVTGIILWSKGAKKYNRHMEMESGAATSLSFSARGMTLSYRF